MYLCKINSFLRLFLFQVLDIFSEKTQLVMMVVNMPNLVIISIIAVPPGSCCLSATVSRSESKSEVPSALLWKLGGHYILVITMSIVRSIRNSASLPFWIKTFLNTDGTAAPTSKTNVLWAPKKLPMFNSKNCYFSIVLPCCFPFVMPKAISER